MNSARTFFALSLAGLMATASAQAPADKPLTEKDLIKRIDVLNTPSSNRPRLGLEGTGLDEKKRPPAPKKAKGATTITSNEATFDNKTREAVFIGKVEVKDPEFNVQCDRLDAFLKKGPEKVVAADPPPVTKAEDKEEGKGKGSTGGLERAIADANPGGIVVITQDKVETDGSITKNIGKARRADYNAKTGDIVLSGNPSVQTGPNTCVALEDGVVMTLNRDGRMKADGPTKVIINDTGTLNGK